MRCKTCFEFGNYYHEIVHIDIISTVNRTVMATLADGTEVMIYKDGEFQIELL